MQFHTSGGALEAKCTRAERVADYSLAGASSSPADREGRACAALAALAALWTGSCEQGKQFRRLLDFSLRV